MATLVKPPKKVLKAKIKKTHSLIESFGVNKKNGFKIDVKPRKELWGR